jgi:hypothetical protein
VEAVVDVEQVQPAGEQLGSGGGQGIGYRIVLPRPALEGRGEKAGLAFGRVDVAREVEVLRIEAGEVGKVTFAEEKVAQGFVPGDVELA